MTAAPTWIDTGCTCSCCKRSREYRQGKEPEPAPMHAINCPCPACAERARIVQADQKESKR